MNSKKKIDIIRRMSSIINFVQKDDGGGGGGGFPKLPSLLFFREGINVHPNGSQEQKCSVP